MGRPLTHRSVASTVPDLDFLPIAFRTVTSGNPTETYGRVIHSVERIDVGVYVIGLNAKWRTMLPVGPTAQEAVATDAVYDVKVSAFEAGEVAEGEGQIEFTVKVNLITGDGPEPSDGDGGSLLVSLVIAGMQIGAN